MRRLQLVSLVTMLVLPVVACAARDGFVDTFDTLDTTRWSVGDHPLGRGHLDPGNVEVSGGMLALGLAGLDGAELRSNATFASGVARARLRVADAPSSLTGFFLYAPPDYASEIDIEIHNDPSGTVIYSTYANGRQTHTVTQALGFDPTAAFHAYEISWDAGKAGFSVDGELVRAWNDGIPTAPMALYANAWFPTWSDGVAVTEPRASLVDEIEYRAR